MRKSVFKAIATGVMVSFVMMTSSISASCNDGWYSSSEFDLFLEDFYKEMEADGFPVDRSADQEDPKIAHPTDEYTNGNNGWYTGSEFDKFEENFNKRMEEQGFTVDNDIIEDSSNSSEPPKEEKPCTHEYVSEVTKEPTCTEKGETTYTCSVCGDSYTEDIQPTGHNYDRTVAEDATCTTPGLFVYICGNCNDSYTEEIPAEGHGELETVVEEPAGLFTKGKQITRCMVCNEVIEEMDIPSKAADGLSKIGSFFKKLFS